MPRLFFALVPIGSSAPRDLEIYQALVRTMSPQSFSFAVARADLDGAGFLAVRGLIGGFSRQDDFLEAIII